MDLADQADQVNELWRGLRLRATRAAAAEPLRAAVACLNCEAPTAAGARWCSPECRDDYLRREARAVEG